MRRIAVIGSGIAGMGAAWLLSRRHDITVFEKNHYAGGHSNTMDAEVAPGVKIPVDTGFIVFNHRNYPNLVQLFEHLGVATEKSDMSFAISVEEGRLEYSGKSLNGLFAQRSNLFNPRYLGMLKDVLRFNRIAPRLLETNEDITLGEYLKREGFGDYFRRYYILPMGAAIWSSTQEKMEAFPALTFVRFFYNHGLTTVTDQPQWYTVTGGSREYVKKLTALYADKVKLNCAAKAVVRVGDAVEVHDERGETHRFDAVIMACHADQALALLAQPTLREKELLGAFGYSHNRAYLHCDTSLMPKRKAAWSSWNYISSSRAGENGSMILTYWMNLLQNLDKRYPLFVTLNPAVPPSADHTYAVCDYEHPLFTKEAIAAQSHLGEIQGEGGIWYCGSYFNYGFHEDAFTSALQVCQKMGIQAPWPISPRK